MCFKNPAWRPMGWTWHCISNDDNDCVIINVDGDNDDDDDNECVINHDDGHNNCVSCCFRNPAWRSEGWIWHGWWELCNYSRWWKLCLMLLDGQRVELDNGNDDDNNVSEGWTWPSQVSPLCSPKRSAHCTNTHTNTFLWSYKHRHTNTPKRSAHCTNKHTNTFLWSYKHRHTNTQTEYKT